jgi:hypothetical protein
MLNCADRNSAVRKTARNGDPDALTRRLQRETISQHTKAARSRMGVSTSRKTFPNWDRNFSRDGRRNTKHHTATNKRRIKPNTIAYIQNAAARRKTCGFSSHKRCKSSFPNKMEGMGRGRQGPAVVASTTGDDSSPTSAEELPKTDSLVIVTMLPLLKKGLAAPLH